MRNQVNCRLAYWRVAVLPNVMASSRDIFPDNKAEISGTPIARIIGALVGKSRNKSASTSSTAPQDIIASKRASHRAYSQSRGGNRTKGCNAISVAMPPTLSLRQSAMLRPVLSMTSSARAMRLLSAGASAAAINGSFALSAAYASATWSARILARRSGSTSGIGAMPSSNVRKYRPVPPTRTGNTPLPCASAIASFASAAHRAAEQALRPSR